MGILRKIFGKEKHLKEEKLREQFEKETGKHAVWRGKITKQYLEWKNSRAED